MIKVQRNVAILLLLSLAACANDQATNQYLRRNDKAPLVDDKYSLKADREKMNAYRSEVPEDKRRENDEVALSLQMFSQVGKTPEDIRNKFDSAVRKKRELFNKDMEKEREQFTKQERQAREDFLKSQKGERDSFLREKPGKDQRDRFFQDQDEKRKDFFANERDKRADFESDVRERRKSFEDYVREKQNDFNQEYRAYLKTYEEWKKQKSEPKRYQPPEAAIPRPGVPTAKSNPEADALEKEMNELRNKPGTSLETGE